MPISTDAEKHFPTPISNKKAQQTITRKELPQSTEGYQWKKKTIGNIILNNEKLNAFPLSLENREQCLLLTTSSQHSTRSPSQCNKIRKKKDIQIRKENINLSLLTIGIIVNIENSLESTKSC